MAVVVSIPAARADDDGQLGLGGYFDSAYGFAGAGGMVDGGDGPVWPGLGHVIIGSNLDSGHRTAPTGPAALGPSNPGWINRFLVPERSDSEIGDLRASTYLEVGQDKPMVTYFTPRFSGLQFGTSYSPTRLGTGYGLGSPGPAEPAGLGRPSRDRFVLGVNYVENFEGIDLAFSGGYRRASGLHLAPYLVNATGSLPNQDYDLDGYSVGTYIGLSGLTLSGFYTRDVSDGLAIGQTWDAGLAYARGPWTMGLDYIQGQFAGDPATGALREDELWTIQAGLSYSVGPGMIARFNVLHSSLEDSYGNASAGTLGVLGFSYNF